MEQQQGNVELDEYKQQQSKYDSLLIKYETLLLNQQQNEQVFDGQI